MPRTDPPARTMVRMTRRCAVIADLCIEMAARHVEIAEKSPATAEKHVALAGSLAQVADRLADLVDEFADLAEAYLDDSPTTEPTMQRRLREELQEILEALDSEGEDSAQPPPGAR